jgi:hypothetical protein
MQRPVIVEELTGKKAKGKWSALGAGNFGARIPYDVVKFLGDCCKPTAFRCEL